MSWIREFGVGAVKMKRHFNPEELITMDAKPSTSYERENFFRDMQAQQLLDGTVRYCFTFAGPVLGWTRFFKPSAYPIRKWTVPVGDCIAMPTNDFYRSRFVVLTNEGNALHQKWVALDRYNDADWHENRYTHDQIAGHQDIDPEEIEEWRRHR